MHAIRPAMDHISTDYGVDSSSRFPFRTQTKRETELKALATPATDRLAWVNKQKDSKHAVRSSFKNLIALLSSGQMPPSCQYMKVVVRCI